MAFGDLKGTLEGGNVNTFASNNATGSVAVNVGDLIYVVFGKLTAPPTSPPCSDNLPSNTYTRLNNTDAGFLAASSFYSIATDTGTLTTVTVGATTGPDNWVSTVAVFEGPFSTIDRNPAVVTTTGTSLQGPPTGTLSQAKEIVVHWMVSDNGGSVTPSFPTDLAISANISGGLFSYIAYRVVTTTASTTPGFSASLSQDQAALCVTSFKAAPAVALVAGNLATQQPTFSTALFTQKQAFGANAVAVNPPILGTPTLGQKHAFVANSAVAGPPAFGSIGVFVARVFAAPPAMVVNVPIFGAPAIGQSNVLTAAWFPVSPILGTGVLGQKHVLPLAVFSKTANQIGVGLFGAGRQILAASFAVSAPILAAALFGQGQTLLATGLAASAPTLGTPTPPLINRILTAADFANSAPSMTAVPLKLNDTFQPAPNLIIGHPAFGPSWIEIRAAPEVWLRHRLKRWSNNPNAEYYDDDHSQNEGPVKAAIFTNLNDEIELSVSAQTLVGRTSPGRGPAETIRVVPPLYMNGLHLYVEWSVVEQLLARVTALEHLTSDPDSFLNIGFYADAAALPTPPVAPPGVTVLAYDNGANKLKVWDPGSGAWRNA